MLMKLHESKKVEQKLLSKVSQLNTFNFKGIVSKCYVLNNKDSQPNSKHLVVPCSYHCQSSTTLYLQMDARILQDGHDQFLFFL
jgi:hypothetical protein